MGILREAVNVSALIRRPMRAWWLKIGIWLLALYLVCSSVTLWAHVQYLLSVNAEVLSGSRFDGLSALLNIGSQLGQLGFWLTTVMAGLAATGIRQRLMQESITTFQSSSAQLDFVLGLQAFAWPLAGRLLFLAASSVADVILTPDIPHFAPMRAYSWFVEVLIVLLLTVWTVGLLAAGGRQRWPVVAWLLCGWGIPNTYMALFWWLQFEGRALPLSAIPNATEFSIRFLWISLLFHFTLLTALALRQSIWSIGLFSLLGAGRLVYALDGAIPLSASVPLPLWLGNLLQSCEMLQMAFGRFLPLQSIPTESGMAGKMNIAFTTKPLVATLGSWGPPVALLGDLLWLGLITALIFFVILWRPARERALPQEPASAG